MSKTKRKQKKLSKRKTKNRKSMLNRRAKIREEAKKEKLLDQIRRYNEVVIDPIINKTDCDSETNLD